MTAGSLALIVAALLEFDIESGHRPLCTASPTSDLVLQF